MFEPVERRRVVRAAPGSCIAATTPAIVAWTPDSSTSYHSAANPIRYGHSAVTPNRLSADHRRRATAAAPPSARQRQPVRIEQAR